MSAAQTQKESSEAGWGCLEALGLSQKELVLAEALQMEYDALSRLKQDKGGAGTSQTGSLAPSNTRSTVPGLSSEHPRPTASQPIPAPVGGSLLRGLSGSDSSLNQPGGSQSPHSIPGRVAPPYGGYIKESLYILDSPGTKFRDGSTSSLGPGTGSGILPKALPTLPNDIPPAIPPRNPIPPLPGSENPFLPPRGSIVFRDVNLFTPEVDQPKVTSGELNYDNINDSLSRLNETRQGPRGRRTNGDQSGRPVARSKTLPPQVPPRTYMPVPKSNKNQRRVSADPVSQRSRMNGFGYELFQVSEERDEEVAGFCHMLDVLRSAYPHSDHSKNAGFVWSPSVGHEELHQGLGVSVKVTVISEHFREPLTFTCDGSSTVDLLIYQTLCYAQDDLDHMDVDDYLLKVCGHDEFLNNSQTLAGLEFVQQCMKFDWDVQLFLTKRSAINTELARTKEDDETVSTMNHSILLQERPIKQTVTREALTLLLDTFHNEAETFLLSEAEMQLHVERLVQSVKALCSSLASVETPDVTAALSQLPACPCRLQPKVLKDTSVLCIRENREKVVEKLTATILDLVELYCSTFNANFHTMPQNHCCTAPVQEAGLVTNVLSFNVYAAHRIPITWAASYEGFFLSCSLTHGGAELCAPQHTSKQSVSKYLFHLVFWDQRVCFPVQINQLPRESQLTVTLYATSLPPPGGNEEKGKQRRSMEALGWVTMPLFNFRHVLTCGRKLLGLWPSTPGRSGNARTSSSNFSQPDSVILQVDFPTSSFEVRFSTPPPADFCPQYDFSRLDTISQIQLQDVLHKKAAFWLTAEDRRLLWEKKAFCQAESAALPLVLASAPCWQWACLPDIYALLRQWACLGHLDALGLLHASFPDQEVRRTAVQWMDSISDPELLDFLPQLVQALKYECYLDSSLVRFLLRRAIGDVRIAHYLFWLLKDNLQDSQFSARYQHLLAALLCCVGRALRDEFDRQCWLVSILAKVAHKVRDAAPSGRQCVLRDGLEEMKQFFSVNRSCRLPLNPALLVTGINIQSCSFFNSNAVPLKLSFQNLDSLGDNVQVIFKSGDDLRQDMLTLQMIRIMNKIWIQEGLDMRMVLFKCFSTGRGRGMVEMIPHADTLRKIQVEHGVTGSFKDRPLADWLQKHNPTDEQYDKAVENFIYSCAGCCVATYILGICDRHNDNIMLKSSGHMFHIDFGKILGHAQMFGNIKRDRAPFVFTSDMAYVINGGDKPSSRFHDFVDLCCEAYNLIRKHTHLFLNLLGLMLSCGIPELSDLEDLKYVYDALRPHESEADATMYFTRLIESSLGSVATKLNFFIHNLAQMKFASTEDRPTLSFAPRLHTVKSDGLIRNLYICRHVRTTSKGYAFVVKVERDGQQEVMLIQRTFEEFHELHSKLRLIFPSSKLPSFPSRFVIGRSRGEAMADRRKDELNGYVWHLIHAAPEVAQCDLVYTFFHPLPRDERPGTTTSKPAEISWSPASGKELGEVKLSISYKNDKLFIMVMHIRGLQPLQDGTDPDPYVKLYLLPDPQKTSKRKTKAARRTCNPTYNEMLVYERIPRGDLDQRVIHLRVLGDGAFWENTLLGETFIPLKRLVPGQHWVDWHQLGGAGSDSSH
ncbi:phosphatidylinositol 4-phosphate 3-kinase C2 domain-containing subunit beta [Parambassis ranga]|uniref:Phosphatidylinositol 4-phosphate 3-kinase C2 domain-containing subunit beta n=1 Tax=Parambassis ranga TaxID=210632 RepID=A0A6P7KBI3_9TELE|nr:phosphatidylinositol 4-phosphate 3-kinase C2 domain-containing subunit beta [Parambassis ranga]XP_028284837.1 phosphatidylinositol 4-phosphate 3-kinase C2 domain-containing subunit beta [Parambassis ranga]XP_028284839.1 phosphatidylinositol 4-phosphate 3-kinase C2 domain-containing subunit beta [Parambassis ranga]